MLCRCQCQPSKGLIARCLYGTVDSAIRSEPLGSLDQKLQEIQLLRNATPEPRSACRVPEAPGKPPGSPQEIPRDRNPPANWVNLEQSELQLQAKRSNKASAKVLEQSSPVVRGHMKSQPASYTRT